MLPKTKTILASTIAIGIALVGSVLWAQGSKNAGTPAPFSQPNGRFVAIQPPAAGDSTYHNFIWVLDTTTGKMNAFRISSINDNAGKHTAWITERLLTDYEYYQLQQQIEKK